MVASVAAVGIELVVDLADSLVAVGAAWQAETYLTASSRQVAESVAVEKIAVALALPRRLALPGLVEPLPHLAATQLPLQGFALPPDECQVGRLVVVASARPKPADLEQNLAAKVESDS